MKMIRTVFLIFLLLFAAIQVFAQDDVTPESTPTIEAVPSDVPLEAETPVDVHNWIDDVSEFITNNMPIMFLGATLLLSVAKIKQPQTQEEYEATRRDVLRQREEARRSETPLDDLMVEARNILNEMRGISASLPTQPSPPSPLPRGEGSNPSLPPVTQPEPPFVPEPEIPLLAKGIPINRNSTLNETGANGLSFIEADRDGRKIAVPHGYAYKGEPGSVDGKMSPHCEVYYKPAAGFEFALADKAGWFGYEFTISNFVLAGQQRFAVVVEYEAAYAPVFGPDNNPTVYIAGSLKSNGRQLAKLPKQPIVAVGKGEAQWVFMTQDEYATLDGALGVYMPYGAVDDTGTLLIKQIKIVPVVDEYGNDNPAAIIRI